MKSTFDWFIFFVWWKYLFVNPWLLVVVNRLCWAEWYSYNVYYDRPSALELVKMWMWVISRLMFAYLLLICYILMANRFFRRNLKFVGRYDLFHFCLFSAFYCACVFPLVFNSIIYIWCLSCCQSWYFILLTICVIPFLHEWLPIHHVTAQLMHHNYLSHVTKI